MRSFLKGVPVCLLVFILSYLSYGTSWASENAFVKAVIFDCDGVLINSEILKLQAWQKAFLKHHIQFTKEDYQSLVGFDTATVLNKFVEKKKLVLPKKEIIAARNAFYKELSQKNTVPIAKTVQLVKELSKKKIALGIQLALASSASHAEINRNLKAIQLDHSFDFIISGEDDLTDIQDPTGRNKPKPYIYQRLAQKLQVSPKDCLVVEDASPGVIAAFDAGMTVLAVPNAFTQKQDFKKAIKVVTLDTLKEAIDHYLPNAL